MFCLEFLALQDQIGELKEKYTNLDLVKDLPNGFALFMEVPPPTGPGGDPFPPPPPQHLQSLGYPNSPDYSYLRSLLQGILDAEGAPPAPLKEIPGFILPLGFLGWRTM